ncbi:MAG: hypothetical protein JW936_02955 [Sedimentisphaerales bacterium]|nr:hypothetical protein [Sedimentisphaerales bacterium]
MIDKTNQTMPNTAPRAQDRLDVNLLPAPLAAWEKSLDATIAAQTVRQVAHWLSSIPGQDPRRVAKAAAEPSLQDAILAFAQFCSQNQHLLAKPTPQTSPATAAPPVKSTPQTNQQPANQQQEDIVWIEMVPDLRIVEYNSLRKLCTHAPADLRKNALILRSVLHLFFNAKWSVPGEIQLSLAFQAGELICGLCEELEPAMRNTIMAQACKLLNSQPEFGAQFRAQSLTVPAGFDTAVCENPQGTRRGNSVEPLSFYIVRQHNNQPVRRALVRWV